MYMVEEDVVRRSSVVVKVVVECSFALRVPGRVSRSEEEQRKSSQKQRQPQRRHQAQAYTLATRAPPRPSVQRQGCPGGTAGVGGGHALRETKASLCSLLSPFSTARQARHRHHGASHLPRHASLYTGKQQHHQQAWRPLPSCGPRRPSPAPLLSR